MGAPHSGPVADRLAPGLTAARPAVALTGPAAAAPPSVSSVVAGSRRRGVLSGARLAPGGLGMLLTDARR